MQTLNNFFNTQTESMEWVDSITKSQQFAQVKKQMAEDLASSLLPPALFNLLIMRLNKALDLEIGDILGWAWRKRQEIIQYRDKENPPAGSHKVPLVEHTVVSKHSPTFQVKINEQKLPSIKIDITLKLKLKGMILLIRDGKIMEAQTGTCMGEGSIAYAGLTFMEKKTAPFTLPGHIPFDQGLPI